MEHDFLAARPAAQHCRELTQRGPRPAERTALLAAWRRDLAKALAEALGILLAGERLTVSVPEPETVPGRDALARIGPLAANSLLKVGDTGETALLSFDFATAIALTDRSFGGDGRVQSHAPDQLPRSAALLVDEIAAIIAQCITRASRGDQPPPAGGRPCGEVLVRSESAVRLKPFEPDAPTLLFNLSIADRQGYEWRCLLALAEERMQRLLPAPDRAPTPGGMRARRRPADPLAAPFAGVPLPLRAVLAEIELPLVRLQSLAPGDMLPLVINREAPLMLGETLVAHGSIGTLENRMALRLTRFPPGISTQGPAR
jgi:flagellar motor switch/type III secretory pathway protein FliN